MRDRRFRTLMVLEMGRPMMVVGAVMTGIVTLMLLAGLTGPLFESIAGMNQALQEAETGSPEANTIMGVFPLVVAVGASLGFVGLILGAVTFADLYRSRWGR
jgi:hypothetical protein